MIGYISSEVKDKLKLADYESTKTFSQQKTEQIQELFFPVYQLCSTQNRVWPHFLCYGELKTPYQEESSIHEKSRMLGFTE